MYLFIKLMSNWFSLIAWPLLANADGCRNIVTLHHIHEVHIGSWTLLTLSLSSPPILDYICCGMLLQSLHLIYLQKPSAYTCPSPPHIPIHLFYPILCAFTCNVNNCHHRNSFLFHYSTYLYNSNLTSTLHEAVLEYLNNLSPSYPLPIVYASCTMLCLYVMCTFMLAC